MTGIKYVPVKVKTTDLSALKEKYVVVENGDTLIGGFSENQLKSYTAIADVTANTNGLKTAEKQEDGSFAFSARVTGSYSGLKDTQLATADVTPNIREGEDVGSFGEFIRVDLNGNYGGLGSAMQAVEWTYYGNDSTYTTPVRTFGTKFAADNWMHKSMGIQLGLTESLRCELPEGTDGTGYWKLTVYALGYEDYSYSFEIGKENIAEPKVAGEEDIKALQDKIDEASALNESDYTKDSWDKMMSELEESKELLASENPLQSAVKEQTIHMTEAIEALVKSDEQPANVDTSSLEKAIADAKALKEADYTADSWKALQSALSDAEKALEAKESQEIVDNATDSLNKAIKALVKKATVTKKDETTNDKTINDKTSGTKKGSNSVQTGDPANVLGWLGLAVSSLGAGAGSFAWRRKKRK